MAKALRAATLGVAVLLLCGCGTVANLETGARQGWKNAIIYGGVRRDVQSAGNWIDHSWTWGDNLDVVQDIGSVVGVGLVGIDIPLSAVGDTLTLPITVPIALWNNSATRTSYSRKTSAPSSTAVIPANEK